MITLSPVVSNGSVPTAQQRCVQMSNERVIPVVFLCVYVSWIVTLDDVITLSLPHLFTFMFPLLCSILSAQFSLAVIILYHFLTLPHSVRIGVYGCTNQSITAAGRK